MSVIRLIVTSFFVLTSLNAKVEDHLKPITDKQGIYKIPNIDCIYLIGSDQRLDRFIISVGQLYPLDIYPCRFSAINGSDLSLEVINDLGVVYQPGMPTNHIGAYYASSNSTPQCECMHVPGRSYFARFMSQDAIANVLNHLSVIQDALDSNYETIWVMEDIIRVVKDPHILSQYIEQLDALVGSDGWDVLFTDPDAKNNGGNAEPCYGYTQRPNFSPNNERRFARRVHINDLFMQVGARYSSYSMILRRSGMQKISQFIKDHSIFLPYDMDYVLPNDIRLFCTRQDIVSTCVARTEIH